MMSTDRARLARPPLVCLIMAGGMSWQEFENIVARLQKAYAKNGRVTRNEKILGRHSKRVRQIDISIRVDVAGEELLVVVECKKWNKKPNVKDVESFIGMMDDVKAHAGIMISTEGFTKSAMNTAETHRVSLYRYRDTQKEGWPGGIETKAFLEIWELTPTLAAFGLKDGSYEDIPSDEGFNFIDQSTGDSIPMATILRIFWDKRAESEKKDGPWTVAIECSTPERSEICALVLGADCKMVKGFRPGRLHFEGLEDERGGFARVEGWKMIFDGELIPASDTRKFAPARTTCVLMKSTYIHTRDPKTIAIHDCIYRGILEVTLTGKNLIKLPLDSADYSKYVQFGSVSSSEMKVAKRANRMIYLEAPLKGLSAPNKSSE